jgi:hypothetical protein
MLLNRNSRRGEKQMSSRSRALLQQVHHRIQHEVWKRNQPQQETKRKERPLEGTPAETKDKGSDPPHYKRQHVRRKPLI